MTMNGTCLQCDGCGYEVRLSEGADAHAPHPDIARAFGWQMTDGEHLCPVCLEAREMANEMAEAAAAQSKLILPPHVQQKRREKTPGQKLSRLFAKPPEPPTQAQVHEQMLQALSGHAAGALAVVRDYLQPPQGLCWDPGDGSAWRVVISRAQADSQPEEAPELSKVGV